MGCVRFGAPRYLIEWLKHEFGVTTFVETGTHFGSTSAWASDLFEQVVTIEGSAYYHAEAMRRHATKQNIQFLLGDSRTLLKDVLTNCRTPAIFWLDAHWMGVDNVFGDSAQCPVMEEINSIRQSGIEHFILVDDARFFLVPPPLPHRAVDWPTVGEVTAALEQPATTMRYTVISDDVIVSVPASAREATRAYYQRVATAEYHANAVPSLRTRIKGAIKKRLAFLGLNAGRG